MTAGACEEGKYSNRLTPCGKQTRILSSALLSCAAGLHCNDQAFQALQVLASIAFLQVWGRPLSEARSAVAFYLSVLTAFSPWKSSRNYLGGCSRQRARGAKFPCQPTAGLLTTVMAVYASKQLAC